MVGAAVTHANATEKRDGINMGKDETTSTSQIFTTRL
jgi:hypothetical protein